MGTYQNKTVETNANVEAFVAGVRPERRRKDAEVLLKMFKSITRTKPKMWGPTIIGFGKYHHRYESGHEFDGALAAFSPRKANLVFHVARSFPRYERLMSKLGKHKLGAGCMYINKLDDVDLDVLRELVAESWKYMRKKYR